MPPLISIPLITYNGERFLRRQLDSIYGQSYPNIEVIACDDRSTDGTMDILGEYRLSHGLTIVANSENLGYLRNFEKAVSLCRGDYIAPSDQDDIWQPQKIEMLVNAIGPASLAFSDAKLIGNDGETITESAISWSRLPARSGKPFTQLLFSSFVIGCTALFTRDLARKAFPIPVGELYHDWWLSMVASTLEGIVFVPEPLILYRRHESNSIGIEKDGGWFGHLFGFLYRAAEKDEFPVQAKRLKAIASAPQFTQAQQQQIRVALRYFEDRSRRRFLHLKAFAIALRLQKEIFPSLGGLVRFKAVLGSLWR